jgi:hypothetical protein
MGRFLSFKTVQCQLLLWNRAKNYLHRFEYKIYYREDVLTSQIYPSGRISFLRDLSSTRMVHHHVLGR